MSAQPHEVSDVRALAPAHRSRLGRATIGDQLRRLGSSQPTKAAIVAYTPDGERSVTTYADLDAAANRAAQTFLDAGIRRGDRIAVYARNRVETAVAYYGALKAGAAYSGISAVYGPAEVAHQVGHLEPAIVVVAAEFLPVLEEALRDLEIRPQILVLDAPEDERSFETRVAGASSVEPEVEVDEHDLAMVVYTSGTEAAPKGVMIAHRNYLISTAPAFTWGLRCRPEDVWLFIMPLHTVAGVGTMTSLLTLGATIVLPASAEPGESLRMIRTEQINVIAQTPTFFIALAEHPDFSAATVGSVQRCLSYGGQVLPRTIDAFADAAPGLVWGTYWGQSELAQLGTVGWFRRLEDMPGQDATWIGRPVGHLETRIVPVDDGAGEHANQIAEGEEIGELWCRTPSVMLGYLKDPERTAAVLAEDWVHTGDIMRRDVDGNLFFADRVKDMIKTGGFNVSSPEVERVLQSHPAVARAAVVGLPDERWSEAVTAFVMVLPGAEASDELAAELRSHCRASLAGYKVPKSISFVAVLPTDSQGKVLKRELRRLHGKG